MVDAVVLEGDSLEEETPCLANMPSSDRFFPVPEDTFVQSSM